MPPEGVRETDKAYVVAVTPDVCLTPMGAAAVPVPYPIVGTFNNVVLLAKSVRMCGRPTFTTASQVTQVMGDEAGTGGGVKSGVNMSVCESVTASSTVRAEGNRVLRHGDVLKMNNGNTLGKVIFMPGLGPVILGESSGGGGIASRVFDWGIDFAAGQIDWGIDFAKGIGTGAVEGVKFGVLGAGYTFYKAFETGKAVASDPVGFGKQLTKPYTEAYEKGGLARVAGRLAPDVALVAMGGEGAEAARATEAAKAAKAAEAAKGARAAEAARAASDVPAPPKVPDKPPDPPKPLSESPAAKGTETGSGGSQAQGARGPADAGNTPRSGESGDARARDRAEVVDNVERRGKGESNGKGSEKDATRGKAGGQKGSSNKSNEGGDRARGDDRGNDRARQKPAKKGADKLDEAGEGREEVARPKKKGGKGGSGEGGGEPPGNGGGGGGGEPPGNGGGGNGGVRVTGGGRPPPTAAPGGNWTFRPVVDVDLRGRPGTAAENLREALKEAFERTGVPRDEFRPTRYARNDQGQLVPVEWRGPRGAEVNIEDPALQTALRQREALRQGLDPTRVPAPEGPANPHVGYKTPGKKNQGGGQVGHVILDEVPVSRGIVEEQMPRASAPRPAPPGDSPPPGDPPPSADGGAAGRKDE